VGADATHRPCPVDGQAPGDVLVGGDDEGPERPPVLWAAAAVAAALLAGATAVDPSPEPDAALLALRAGHLVPRDRILDDRLAEAGMHVEVVNASDRTLDVRGASLLPGAWEVDVVDRSLLQPGESVVLSLHRTVVCDERASYGPFPEHLVVEARTEDDEAALVRLPVADPSAYGGLLDDALRDPGRACVVAGDEVGGPIGDLVGSWRARRASPPSPRPD
jgi:hypothetical protein